MSKTEKPNHEIKLLDAWDPPQESGEPIGILATSFTFHSEFFESECLARFIKMQSDLDDHRAVYVFEREAKLAVLRCAAVLVDAQHAFGDRSLRWKLLPIKVQQGCQHSKVSLLVWSNCIRVIIASANLTETGYRQNQEIFSFFDFSTNCDNDLELLISTIDFLKTVLLNATLPLTSIPRTSTSTFLDEVMVTAQRWRQTSKFRSQDRELTKLVFVGPQSKSAFENIQEEWKGKKSRPNMACVTSPFFDEGNDTNEPALRLSSIMAKSGDVDFNFRVSFEKGENDTIVAHAPGGIMKTRYPKAIQPKFFGVTTHNTDKSKEWTIRPLHSKLISIRSDSHLMIFFGSSNFTSAGLGISEVKNFEANVMNFSPYEKGSILYKQLQMLHEDAVEFESEKLIFSGKFEKDEDADEVSVHGRLPQGFLGAVYGTSENMKRITFYFEPALLPKTWEIRSHTQDVLFSSMHWSKDGENSEVKVLWPHHSVPCELNVIWHSDLVESAYLNVQIEDQLNVPNPEELRDLPLEFLLDHICSGLPINRTFEKLEKLKLQEKSGDGPNLDALNRVDSSGFILNRIRRLTRQFIGVREYLEKPIATVENLQWRLFGPVGIWEVALGLMRLQEIIAADEVCFLLSELCYEIRNATPHFHADGPNIGKEEFCRQIDKVIERIYVECVKSMNLSSKTMTSYLTDSFNLSRRAA